MYLKNFRSYEVSIWTLQDSFISVLKPSNLESKGAIQNTNFNIKDDGEETFSFSIPMYIDVMEEGIIPKLKNIINPIWYNVEQGNFVVGMRKIKVIFNKATIDEKVYEFIINKVTESHEGLKKYCEIECGGLAFNELGKQGYRIYLEGENDILTAQKEWIDGGKQGEEPKENINFWADKVFKNSNWTYEVKMDWSSYNSSLSSDKIYEEAFVSSWKRNNDKDELIPERIIDTHEKRRLVVSKESNRYNLSQAIAEAFQVFCKYEYEYDDNYHIIGRKAIFYNNFLKEKEGIVDFIYKYNAKTLNREIDSTDLCSKMFVSSLSDVDMPSGYVNIADTTANKSLEDYLLNFDYLYDIDTITQEQYDEIKIYEAKLRPINIDLNLKSKELAKLQEKLTKLEAKIDNAKESYQKADELIKINNNLRSNLTDEETGTISITNLNPQIFHLLQKSNENTYYFNISELGVIGGTIKIYKYFNQTDRTFPEKIPNTNITNEIIQFSIEKDKNGNVTAVKDIPSENISERNIKKVYATFSYEPHLYYDKIIKIYTTISNRDKATYQANYDKQGEIIVNSDLDKINKAIENTKEEYDDLLRQKREIINKFERFMGASIREGTWQPEDEYSQYGDFYSDNITLGANKNFNDDMSSFSWDEELFDEEQLNYYEYGVELRKIYYPCIDLSNVWNQLVNKDLNNLAFIYSDKFLKIENGQIILVDGADRYYQKWVYPYYFGSKAVLSFIKTSNNLIKPVLLLVGTEEMTDDELTFLNSSYAECRISVINTDQNGTIEEDNVVSANNIEWIVNPLQSKITNPQSLSNPPKTVFPRFQINSIMVKSPKTNIIIYRNLKEKENYKDFYILSRDDKYYVTLKPETLFKDKTYSGTYMLNYTISTAATAIYLDALKILKENAYPKVSYNIELASVNKDFIYNAYSRLGQLVHINDYELKFENTMGYISELQLNLDKPQEDKIIIKNYKTKFEDLFSNIVAQTQQMQKSSSIINMASVAFDAHGMLNQQLIENIDTRLPEQKQEYNINSEELYSKCEPYIRQELKKDLTQMGDIITAALYSIDSVNELTIEGADILAGFKENIKGGLTPATFIDNPNGNGHRYNKTLGAETESFKVGDIWTRNDGNVYMATENSASLYPDGYPADILTSLKGWSRVKDGRLVAITGASLDIDAESGNISINAEKKLNLLCRGLIDVSGNDVTITGNQKVEIGGPDIYIYAADTTGTINTKHGVHIYATRLGTTGATSAVDITGEGIEMAAANGIKFKSGGGINFISSNNINTSAIKIDKNTGIYMGSTQPLIFYSGAIDASGSSAAAKISSDRILFGVTNGKNANGTALDMTSDHLILGSGFVNSNDEPSTTNIGGKSEAAGIKITKDSIHMATGLVGTSSRNYLSMDQNGIMIGNVSNESNGATVAINHSGVLIGSKQNETIYKNDIQSNEPGSHNLMPNYSGAKFEVYAPNFVVDADGHIYAYAADIFGNITANNLYLQDGTMDVAGILNQLLSGSYENPDGTEIDENNDAMMVIGYSNNNWIKVRKPNGKTATINFNRAQRYGSTTITYQGDPISSNVGRIYVKPKNIDGSELDNFTTYLTLGADGLSIGGAVTGNIGGDYTYNKGVDSVDSGNVSISSVQKMSNTQDRVRGTVTLSNNKSFTFDVRYNHEA